MFICMSVALWSRVSVWFFLSDLSSRVLVPPAGLLPFLSLLMACFHSSGSWWLACLPFPLRWLAWLPLPCAGLRPFLFNACVLDHPESYLPLALLLLLPLLLSFPPFPTPFSSGMIPNGTTPAGRVVGRGEMENRRCRRWRGMRALSLPSAPTHSLPCLPLCLPPLHGSFSLLRVNVSFYLSWVSPVWGGCLLLLALLVRSCPKIEWCFKFS